MQRQIVDGTKVVVFSAKFQAEDTSTAALSYNHVRRAEGSLRLGPLPMTSLQRGVTIGSIKPGTLHEQHHQSSFLNQLL